MLYFWYIFIFLISSIDISLIHKTKLNLPTSTKICIHVHMILAIIVVVLHNFFIFSIELTLRLLCLHSSIFTHNTCSAQTTNYPHQFVMYLRTAVYYYQYTIISITLVWHNVTSGELQQTYILRSPEYLIKYYWWFENNSFVNNRQQLLLQPQIFCKMILVAARIMIHVRTIDPFPPSPTTTTNSWSEVLDVRWRKCCVLWWLLQTVVDHGRYIKYYERHAGFSMFYAFL